ncbi:MAG: 16S rRNA (adenine(1518)-N(6)/adenine(1519)-N(6))-dimethyltransferase RsmA [Gudongella sp.]|nr:16S rRNA (adenine(1518)-N(6)/adenine(1519)-N(6))-dimethyltransferase RsmA [Gudongella sp.]
MENKRLYSPARVKEILDMYGFRFSKGLGQNFLIDGNIVREIVKRAEVSKEDQVLEIGPGIGTLTEELALNADKVVAIEIDERLRPVLADTLSTYDNTEIVFGDVLKLPLDEILKEKFEDKPVKVVANLPYYVTTPIIGKLLEEGLAFDSISVMVQKEVADRMIANPGSKDYGALTLFIKFYTEPEVLLRVPKSVFMPQPKIDSTVVRLKLKKELPDIDRELYSKLVKAAFSKRRKTIINALSTYGLEFDKQTLKEALQRAGIEETARGEELTVEKYIQLVRQLTRSE